MVSVCLAQFLIGGSAPFLGPTVAAITLGIVGTRAFGKQFGKNQSFNSAGQCLHGPSDCLRQLQVWLSNDLCHGRPDGHSCLIVPGVYSPWNARFSQTKILKPTVTLRYPFSVSPIDLRLL